jgi:hypothetical protein
MSFTKHPINPQPGHERCFVRANVVAKHYSVTPRFILQLAAENRIPSVRLGVKCVRFDLNEVSKILEGTTK